MGFSIWFKWIYFKNFSKRAQHKYKIFKSFRIKFANKMSSEVVSKRGVSTPTGKLWID